MDAKAFDGLIKQLQACKFSSEKENLIELAVTTNAFSVQQAIAIIGECKFSSDKVNMATLLKDHLSDPQNKDKLLAKFSGLDKTKLEEEFKSIKPKAAMVIPPALLLPNAALRDEKHFAGLIASLSSQKFSSGKMEVLAAELKKFNEGFDAKQTVAILSQFTFSADMVQALQLLDPFLLGLRCSDVSAILKVFKFSNDKLTVLPLLKQTILDGQMKHTILADFTFGSDKEKAAEILASVKAAVPPRSPLFGTVVALNVCFVLDISGSMDTTFKTNTGETISRLKLSVRELKNVVTEQLAANATFQIVTFGTHVQTLFKTPVEATAANREAACKALDALKTAGSTNAAAALKLAFELKSEAIYFLTDGEPDAPGPSGILANVQGYMKQHSAPVHGIAFLLPGKVPAARNFVLNLSKTCNGVFRAFE